MAEAKTITIHDIQSLADRLLNRGVSKLSNDRPEHAGDLRLAAKVIRAMARSFAHGDIVTLEKTATDRPALQAARPRLTVRANPGPVAGGGRGS